MPEPHDLGIWRAPLNTQFSRADLFYVWNAIGDTGGVILKVPLPRRNSGGDSFWWVFSLHDLWIPPLLAFHPATKKTLRLNGEMEENKTEVLRNATPPTRLLLFSMRYLQHIEQTSCLTEAFFWKYVGNFFPGRCKWGISTILISWKNKRVLNRCIPAREN